MTLLTVSPGGRSLTMEGVRTFVVADTAWSAFADAGLDEWRNYVRFRAQQGFTSIMVSVLPILHDRAVRSGAREPFALDEAGHYRFDAPNTAYFDTAREMAAIARDVGLSLGLVVLWCNYVGETWGSERTPWAVMEAGERNDYLALVIRSFAEFDPIFIVSGDERFSSPAATEVYGEALDFVKRAAPRCLTTLHSTPDAVLPTALADSSSLDFYSYQAGHDHERQDRAWLLAEQYLASTVRRPIMDLEPCYEGHGYGGGAGRYRADEVRKATWWSIIGGATAGVGYGAHGVWQWYREGAEFTSPDFSLEPFLWQTALDFPGADDVALAGALVRDHGLVDALPRQDLLESPYPGLRACALDDLSAIAIYLPDAREFSLSIELDGRSSVAWDLTNRRRIVPRFANTASGTTVRQFETAGDVLLLTRA